MKIKNLKWFLRSILNPLAFCVLTLFFSAAFAQEECSDPSPGTLPNGTLAKLQSTSMKHVFYKNNPFPAGFGPNENLSADQQIELTDNLKKLNDEEREILECIYGPIKEKPTRDKHYYFALKDTDGDGIRDYLISTYYGKFAEGDLDVDDDEVLNVYDPRPYKKDLDLAPNEYGIPTKNFTDENNNSIPDFIDFEMMDKKTKSGHSKQAINIQQELFRDHKIILLERSDLTFRGNLAQNVRDAIKIVFGKYFKENKVMPSLRTVTLENTELVNAASLEETNMTVLGVSTSQTNTFTVYKSLFRENDIEKLGFVTHELDHNYEYALDFVPEDEDMVDKSSAFINNYNNARIVLNADKFHALLEPFQWERDNALAEPKINQNTGIPEHPPLLFQNVGGNAPDAWYAGRKKSNGDFWNGDDWEKWLLEFFDEHGDSYLTDPEVEAYFIVNDYSMDSPWEWHAENLRAYVLITMEEGARLQCHQQFEDDETASRKSDEIRNSSRDHQNSENFWFNYSIILKHPELMAYFRKEFPIADSDKKELARRYFKKELSQQGCISGSGTGIL